MQLRSPLEITRLSVETAYRKASLDIPRLTAASIAAGAYIALGAALSVIVGYGFGGTTTSNPAMQRLLSGLVFPVGLVLVVVLGAELFTGNNALLVPACLKRRISVAALLRNWAIVWIGNFIGALLMTYFLVHLTGITDAEPYRSAVCNIASTKTSLPWGVVFLRAVGANWCVCLAVWLALAGKTFTDKVLACWIPVAAFVILGYEHCVANMFFIPCGMLQGADISIAQLLCDNLIPATLGNIVGGALLVGCLQAYLTTTKK